LKYNAVFAGFLVFLLHLDQWFLTGGTRTTWGHEEPKQGVRSTKVFRDWPTSQYEEKNLRNDVESRCGWVY